MKNKKGKICLIIIAFLISLVMILYNIINTNENKEYKSIDTIKTADLKNYNKDKYEFEIVKGSTETFRINLGFKYDEKNEHAQKISYTGNTHLNAYVTSVKAIDAYDNYADVTICGKNIGDAYITISKQLEGSNNWIHVYINVKVVEHNIHPEQTGSTYLRLPLDSIQVKQDVTNTLPYSTNSNGNIYYRTDEKILKVTSTANGKVQFVGLKPGKATLYIYCIGQNGVEINDYVEVTVYANKPTDSSGGGTSSGVTHTAEYYSDTVQFKVGEEAERGFISLDTAFSSYEVLADNPDIVHGEFLMTSDRSYYYMKFTAKESGTTNIRLNIYYSDGAVLKISWPVIVEQGDAVTNKAYYKKDYEDLNMNVGQEIHWRRFLL